MACQATAGLEPVVDDPTAQMSLGPVPHNAHRRCEADVGRLSRLQVEPFQESKLPLMVANSDDDPLPQIDRRSYEPKLRGWRVQAPASR